MHLNACGLGETLSIIWLLRNHFAYKIYFNDWPNGKQFCLLSTLIVPRGEAEGNI